MAGSRIRVMFVIGSLQIGGAQKHVYDLARSLPRDRFELEMVTFVDGGYYAERFRELGIPIRSLNVDSRRQLVLGFRRFLAYIRRRRPDVLHLFLFHSSLYGSVASRLITNRPAVIFSKRSMGLEISRARRVLYRQVIFRCADAVTAVSRPVADECVRLGVAEHSVQVIENGIDWIDAPERGRLRAALGIPASAPLIGAVGSMTRRKRQHLVLRAAPLILAKKPDAHFVVLGDGELRQNLANECERLGIASSVHLPGVMAPATQYLGDLDVFVLPSSEEGTSNALLEAMMLGIPCVTSDIPSNRQVVDDGVDGRVVQVEDARVFAEAVLEALSRSPDVQSRINRARDKVRSRYLLSATVSTNAALYEGLTANRRPLRRTTVTATTRAARQR